MTVLSAISLVGIHQSTYICDVNLLQKQKHLPVSSVGLEIERSRVQFPASPGPRNGLSNCGNRAWGRLPRSTGSLEEGQESSRKWDNKNPCGGGEINK